VEFPETSVGKIIEIVLEQRNLLLTVVSCVELWC